ncbi:MAG: hypothetical protein HYR66_00210 [Sphingobacteriales bacterium]|nr:hypothetical protein [Sphingobacteriales bacterium]MBI3719651.1 hypothetical protein [Sphingobacteriales bacterium]
MILLEDFGRMVSMSIILSVIPSLLINSFLFTYLKKRMKKGQALGLSFLCFITVACLFMLLLMYFYPSL